jgi:hypothetical protein
MRTPGPAARSVLYAILSILELQGPDEGTINASSNKSSMRQRTGGNKMFNIKSETIPGDVEKAHQMPRARTLGLVILAGYITFLLFYLLLWELNAEWQLILNRISWSSSDFVGMAGVGIGLYSYWLLEKYNKNANIIYLNDFVLELKKAGVKPEDVGAMLDMAKSLLKQVGDDPEFIARLQRVMVKIAHERADGLKKLSEAELFEILQSGGGKL